MRAYSELPLCERRERPEREEEADHVAGGGCGVFGVFGVVPDERRVRAFGVVLCAIGRLLFGARLERRLH